MGGLLLLITEGGKAIGLRIQTQTQHTQIKTPRQTQRQTTGILTPS